MLSVWHPTLLLANTDEQHASPITPARKKKAAILKYRQGPSSCLASHTRAMRKAQSKPPREPSAVRFSGVLQKRTPLIEAVSTETELEAGVDVQEAGRGGKRAPKQAESEFDPDEEHQAEILGDDDDDDDIDGPDAPMRPSKESKPPTYQRVCEPCRRCTKFDCFLVLLILLGGMIFAFLLAWVAYTLEQPPPDWLANLGP